MGNPLVSCDDHLDLNMLPADLWEKWLPDPLKDRAPHIEVRDDKAMWVCEGDVWGSWAGRASAEEGPKMNLNAYDRGGIADQTQRRAGTAELRLADMDRDGVYAQLIFGPVTSINHKDTELRDACYTAYNDWLADFCSAAPDRLLGVAMLPEDPESAFAEFNRLAAKHCFRQVNLQIAACETPIYDERWAPLLTAVEESGLVLSFHVVVFLGGRGPNPARGKPAGALVHAKSFVEQFIDPFVDLFAWGVLEKHPRLRIVFGESGVGWLPWLIEELDYRHWRLWEAKDYWAERGGIPLVHKPSELFKRQVYATFQESPTAIRLLDFYGSNNLLWASDYPHPDSVWPNSHAAIERQMGHLPGDIVRQLTFGNAARLYGLDLPESVEFPQAAAAE
ncbi:MAG TPA: amidohydrolase family protein [Sphingomonadaceae bacterium]|nr:amidohydrolase family protein [Sphingomonadaceae bacterium]